TVVYGACRRLLRGRSASIQPEWSPDTFIVGEGAIRVASVERARRGGWRTHGDVVRVVLRTRRSHPDPERRRQRRMRGSESRPERIGVGVARNERRVAIAAADEEEFGVWPPLSLGGKLAQERQADDRLVIARFADRHERGAGCRGAND